MAKECEECQEKDDRIVELEQEIEHIESELDDLLGETKKILKNISY